MSLCENCLNCLDFNVSNIRCISDHKKCFTPQIPIYNHLDYNENSKDDFSYFIESGKIICKVKNMITIPSIGDIVIIEDIKYLTELLIINPKTMITEFHVSACQ